MNEEYAVRLVDVFNNGILDTDIEYLEASKLVAAKKLMMIFEVIDFDKIRTVCDIGSRFMEQTMEMSFIFPKATLYAFEPVPESYATCCANKQLLPVENKARVTVFNYAVGDATKMIPFFPVDNTGSEHNVGASSKYKFVEGLNGSFFGKTWNQTEIQVQQISLDQWRQENNIAPVDMIWMDTQGGELDVLKGATETLKNVRVIFTEVGIGTYYEGQSLKPEIDAYMASMGFEELEGAFVQNHQFEGDTIYVNTKFL